MGIARNPITLSKEFSIDEKLLDAIGVLNCTLAIDTKLFIDPLLLARSKHREMKRDAVAQCQAHFEKIIRLLAGSGALNDAAWKAARRMLQFPEVKGTCLGYGAGSIRGSGFGEKLSERILQIAGQIIGIGIRDPELFTALALFEPDVGPDRLSDMTTNIIFAALAGFNKRVLDELGMQGQLFEHRGVQGEFLVNRYEHERTPVIMVPTDILRDLPIAHDWDGIVAVARQNSELRQRVNEYIAAIWAKKTKRDKQLLKKQVLSSKVAFETLLESLRVVAAAPYDVVGDSEGLVRWATKGQEYAQQYPLRLSTGSDVGGLDDVFNVAKQIVDQFRHLIEDCGLNRELFRSKNKPRHESTAQRLFFAVAHSYCQANNVDVSPEIDTGNGKIDFKLSTGFKERVLVEIKLSTNPSAVAGYTNQLEIYKDSQQTLRAIYLVIDVGRMGKKDSDLIALRNDAANSGQPLSELEFVDGLIKPTASKRK